MSAQRTLCIIKPDACEHRVEGKILERVRSEGFDVLGLKQLRLSIAQAEGFYAVHTGKPFFSSLCSFMTRGPIVVVALSREDAVQHWRTVIGATDPAKAENGTIRKLFGTSLTENAVHGSDSEENGRIEVGYFFSESELR